MTTLVSPNLAPNLDVALQGLHGLTDWRGGDIDLSVLFQELLHLGLAREVF